ncbi:MAG TPA: polymer-forming cytoskeletal protein [Gammaproteobacteria bacterium]|nr:polymer-forming cytoskeletal protein [Gammaproteobacteria bacterium]
MLWGKRKKKRHTRIDSLIGQHSHVSGDVRFSGGLHVDGRLKGNVTAEDEESSVLTLSDRGTIEGDVKVPYVVLNGTVVGDVYARQHIELAANARVEGNVYYNLIEMAVGSTVNGQLVHISQAEKGIQAAAHAPATKTGTGPAS